jgi:hypothetical protein
MADDDWGRTFDPAIELRGEHAAERRGISKLLEPVRRDELCVDEHGGRVAPMYLRP